MKISWFFAGLGLGTLAGVLYAPRSGDEMREAIRSKAEAGADLLADRAREAREQANEWVDRGRDVLNQQKENLRGAYEAGRQVYQDATTPKTGTES
jgi:gas vesicle protein